jgi:carbonic anhydrase/acetyltransferase-like protein (isoleucine patch superfamily)
VPKSTWFAATQAPGKPGAGGGLVDEVFDNIACDGDCDPVALNATGILIPPTGDPLPVNFELATGGGISGVVTSVEAPPGPISQVLLELFDDAGISIATTSTNGLGEYSFEGLRHEAYRLLAKPQAGNYGAVLYNGVYCDGGCDILTGNQIVLNPGSPSASDIDFALPHDNCPNVDNPDQLDTFGDERGDACEGEPPVISNRADVDPSAQIGSDTEIVQGATVYQNVVIGDRSLVSQNAEIGVNCWIGDDVWIGKNVILGENCSIGRESFIEREVVVGDNVTIGSKTSIGKNTQIGDGTTIGDNVELGWNVLVSAGSCIPNGIVIAKNGIVDGDLCQ